MRGGGRDRGRMRVGASLCLLASIEVNLRLGSWSSISCLSPKPRAWTIAPWKAEEVRVEQIRPRVASPGAPASA